MVVGAGFAGSVIARELADSGLSVDVVDQRDHIAGNAYDFVNDVGIRVHKYGPHLFHTSNTTVIQWVNRFARWVPYRHKVKALLPDGQFVTLPANAETLQVVGRDKILDVLFRPYTRKMWGLELEQLDRSVLDRVPIRDDLNEYYFPDDSFQALPLEGYSALVQKILHHPSISVHLGVRFEPQASTGSYEHVFNSTPIDEYFEYRFGSLPYRSIRFHTLTLPVPRLLPTSTVNFTHDEPYTRVTEWKHLPNSSGHPAFTTVTVEEPCDYVDNFMERYYPVKDADGVHRQTYRRYREVVPPTMTFIGRCGLYAYLDMDQAIHSSLSAARKFLHSR